MDAPVPGLRHGTWTFILCNDLWVSRHFNRETCYHDELAVRLLAEQSVHRCADMQHNPVLSCGVCLMMPTPVLLASCLVTLWLVEHASFVPFCYLSTSNCKSRRLPLTWILKRAAHTFPRLLRSSLLVEAWWQIVFGASTHCRQVRRRHIAARVCCADQHEDTAPRRQPAHRPLTSGILQRVGLWLQHVLLPVPKQYEWATAGHHAQLPAV